MTPSPPADPFEIAPRFETMGKARFWPDTLFTEIPLDADIGTSVDDHFERGDVDTIIRVAAGLHEQVHWLQTAGTTFGRFLSRVRFTSNALVDAILATATDEERGKLISARRNGVAPAARNANFGLRHEHGYSVTLQSLFDHWWAMRVLDRALSEGRGALFGNIHPNFVLGLGLRYACADGNVRTVFNAPDEDFFENTTAMVKADSHTPSPLTVQHIEEGAAMTAQYLYHQGALARLPADAKARFEGIVGDWLEVRWTDNKHRLYTDALRSYLDRRGTPATSYALAEFLLICDLALNPAIPADAHEGVSLADFHPVARFERVRDKAASQRWRIRDTKWPTTEWWSTRRADLARAARVSDGTLSGALTTRPTELDDWVDPTSRTADLLAQCGANLTTLRKAAPGAIVAPFTADDQTFEELETALATVTGPSFMPPLLMFNGEGVGSPTISDEDYVRQVIALTYGRAASAWITNPGPLRFDGLPRDENADEIQRRATQRLQTIYGVEL